MIVGPSRQALCAPKQLASIGSSCDTRFKSLLLYPFSFPGQIFRMKHKKAIFVPRRDGISCRIEKENPMTDSPLVTLPDYTFMDGRPTPVGVRYCSASTLIRFCHEEIPLGRILSGKLLLWVL